MMALPPSSMPRNRRAGPAMPSSIRRWSPNLLPGCLPECTFPRDIRLGHTRAGTVAALRKRMAAFLEAGVALHSWGCYWSP